MTPVTHAKGRRLALFGLGGSGLATARALKAGGAHVLAWDDKAESRDKAAIEGIEIADLRTLDWSGIDSLVLSPGVPLTHPEPHWTVNLARAAGVEIIGDIELFFRERAAIAPDAPVVCITGTNGKSTTTALIAHLIREAGRDAQMGGNIGTAVLLLDPPSPARIHVIECSSFQIDLTPSIRPTVGIQMNLTPDHLDRHGTLEDYAAIKERLVAAADIAVIGVDDEPSKAMATRRAATGRPLIRFSAESPITEGIFAGFTARDRVLETRLVRVENRKPRIVADLTGIGSLRGSHNAQNAAAAFAACVSLGIDEPVIAAGLRTYPGLPHRMEELGRKGRVVFINDSKATNADSTEKALTAFRAIYWILGGKAKEGGIESLRRYFPNIARAYLIGAATETFAATLDGHVPFVKAGTLDVATWMAAEDALAANGTDEVCVLLSPACASYDQFPNFEVRGDAFRALVKDILAT
jgi:UDP-N-acetylmuramoylalanine--D-glutamate ligase